MRQCKTKVNNSSKMQLITLITCKLLFCSNAFLTISHLTSPLLPSLSSFSNLENMTRPLMLSQFALQVKKNLLFFGFQLGTNFSDSTPISFLSKCSKRLVTVGLRIGTEPGECWWKSSRSRNWTKDKLNTFSRLRNA